MAEEAQPLTVPDADHRWAWLEEHHGEVAAGVWLTLAKGGAQEPTSLTHAEALQAALAFGCIRPSAISRSAYPTLRFDQMLRARRGVQRWQ